MVPNLQWFNLKFWGFTTGQKQYGFNGNHTSDFEFWSFPGQWYTVWYSLVMLAPTGQRWENLHFNKDINYSRMELIKYV